MSRARLDFELKWQYKKVAENKMWSCELILWVVQRIKYMLKLRAHEYGMNLWKMACICEVYLVQHSSHFVQSVKSEKFAMFCLKYSYSHVVLLANYVLYFTLTVRLAIMVISWLEWLNCDDFPSYGENWWMSYFLFYI
jgi:hypothetical protein